MNKRRRTKTLEKAARAIKDSDEFVEHISNIARGFQEHHELDVSAGARGIRSALKAFEKHAGQLADWLDRSEARASAEQEALNILRTSAKPGTLPYLDLDATRVWLQQAVRASSKAQSELQGTKMTRAPGWAADALRATFERHKLKVSLQASEKKQSDAVKLLCAIAKDGGDASMTVAQARDWLAQSAAR